MSKAFNKFDNKQKNNSSTSSLDSYIGDRIRTRRIMLGLSQEKLAESLGITFQQIQKYERGVNRVSASQLYRISGVLDTPISYFFEGIPTNHHSGLISGVAESLPFDTYQTKFLTKKETFTLLKAYYDIEPPTIRRKILELISCLAQQVQDTHS